MKSEKSLKKELSALSKRQDKIVEQLEKIELAKKLPALKKKYEGKYFKCGNAYNESRKWWIYLYCKKVIETDVGLFDTFQSCKEFGDWNKHEFIVGNKRSLGRDLVEIPESEWLEALQEFKDSLIEMEGYGSLKFKI